LSLPLPAATAAAATEELCPTLVEEMHMPSESNIAMSKAPILADRILKARAPSSKGRTLAVQISSIFRC
jgi:hypothetical protein